MEEDVGVEEYVGVAEDLGVDGGERKRGRDLSPEDCFTGLGNRSATAWGGTLVLLFDIVAAVAGSNLCRC